MTGEQRENARHLGVHSIDHFCVAVPDIDKARHFYTHFGLDVRDVDAGVDLYTFGGAHRWGAIRHGEKKRARYLSLLTYPEDLERFRLHFAALGIKPIAAPAGASVEAGGIWIENPDGLPVHIIPGPKNSPAEREPMGAAGRHSPERGSPLRGAAGPTRPRRLSHVLFFTKDVDRAVKFYTAVLGLRLSDRSGPVAFMHGAHGSDHHMIGLAQSSDFGVHHSAWIVGSIDEIGLGSERMSENGYSRGWGLGRHALGSNYFRYVRDPWGSYAEYSCEIDFIQAGLEWDAWSPPPENSLYMLGPEVPEDFVTNYEAAAGNE